MGEKSDRTKDRYITSEPTHLTKKHNILTQFVSFISRLAVSRNDNQNDDIKKK